MKFNIYLCPACNQSYILPGEPSSLSCNICKNDSIDHIGVIDEDDFINSGNGMMKANINTKIEFLLHKARFNGGMSYIYIHEGEPESYPCIVVSSWHHPNPAEDGYVSVYHMAI